MQIKEQKNISFLCFGGQDWWYHNHGHIDIQLMRRFAKLGKAVYVNSIVMQKPNFSRNGEFCKKFKRKIKSIFTGLKKIDHNFWVYSPFSLPLHHIGWTRNLNSRIVLFQIRNVMRKLNMRNPTILVACPAAYETALMLKPTGLIYFRTDLYEVFPNVDAATIKYYDHNLKQKADLTLYVNRQLYEAESAQCRKALYLDHGVDYEMFASAEKNRSIPPETTNIKRPIVGFFGEINSHTVDIELLEKLAGLLPDMSFVFVGNKAADYPGLTKQKNVWMLGQKPYEQVPDYGKCFDVAIMPWRQTDWIQACNPVKLKEYLALGKPVVSTPFPELKKYKDVVLEADTAKNFADKIKQALKQNSPKSVAARRTKVSNDGWDNKAETVLKILNGEKL
jgi:glycosyltransferase involved in cell wall biosynthesis